MVKVVGLVLVALVVVLFACAWSQQARMRRRALLRAALILWAIASFALVGLLVAEHADVGPASGNCPLPGPDDSAVASSHWSWVPLGEICEYPTGNTEPSQLRIPALLVLIASPLTAIVVWPLRRESRVSRHRAGTDA